MSPKRVLVIEDEDKLRRVLELQLSSSGFDLDLAASGEEGLRFLDRADLILTDLKLPEMDGMQVLAHARQINPSAPVIVMTAFGTIENAVEAMKRGAADFLLKPFSLDHLTAIIEMAL